MKHNGKKLKHEFENYYRDKDGQQYKLVDGELEGPLAYPYGGVSEQDWKETKTTFDKLRLTGAVFFSSVSLLAAIGTYNAYPEVNNLQKELAFRHTIVREEIFNYMLENDFYEDKCLKNHKISDDFRIPRELREEYALTDRHARKSLEAPIFLMVFGSVLSLIPASILTLDSLTYIDTKREKLERIRRQHRVY